MFVAGVTLVAEHNVGAHAALPCLVQDWALHGKRIHTKLLFLLSGEQRGPGAALTALPD